MNICNFSKFAIMAVMVGITTCEPLPRNDTVVMNKGDKETGIHDCVKKHSGVLNERDRLLISVSRKLDRMAQNMTFDEKEMLQNILNNEPCSDEVIDAAIRQYQAGEYTPKREKRSSRQKRASSCSVSCSVNGETSSDEITCERGCSCQCSNGQASCECIEFTWPWNWN